MTPDHLAETILIETSRMQRAAMEYRPMVTFSWDEVSGTVIEDAIDTADWKRLRNNIGPVRVYVSERGHIALEVDAKDEAEARKAFYASDDYRVYYMGDS